MTAKNQWTSLRESILTLKTYRFRGRGAQTICWKKKCKREEKVTLWRKKGAVAKSNLPSLEMTAIWRRPCHQMKCFHIHSRVGLLGLMLKNHTSCKWLRMSKKYMVSIGFPKHTRRRKFLAKVGVLLFTWRNTEKLGKSLRSSSFQSRVMRSRVVRMRYTLISSFSKMQLENIPIQFANS